MKAKKAEIPNVWAGHVLDVSQFYGTSSYELAVLVHRETEAQRTADSQAFRAKYPDPAPQARGLLDLFTGPHDRSIFLSWGEYAKGFDVLFNCGCALGVPIGEIAKRIALELGPDNAEVLYWIGEWLLAQDEKADLRARMQQQTEEIERAKHRQQQSRRAGGLAKHARIAKAKEFVLAEWAKHKDEYKGNRSDFARHYVPRIMHELQILVSHDTISAKWLKGM